jgi:hypothetical protein
MILSFEGFDVRDQIGEHSITTSLAPSFSGIRQLSDHSQESGPAPPNFRYLARHSSEALATRSIPSA